MICCCLCSVFLSILAIILLAAIAFRLYIKYTSGVCIIEGSLAGKNFIVTGATNGIGKETAYELAKKGAGVYLACRSRSRANVLAFNIKEKTRNNNIHVVQLNLASMKSVQQCAQEFLSLNVPLHCLINNAGCMIDGSTRTLTDEGLEMTMATNYFGHFLLTNLLLEKLKQCAPSRVVNVSSHGHKWAQTFDVNNLSMEHVKYDSFVSYCHSKLANVLFTNQLAVRTQGTGVTTNSLHPGVITTNIFPSANPIIRLMYQLLGFIVKTPLEGAQTTLYLATSKDVSHTSGHYFEDCVPSGMHVVATNMELAKTLWEKTEAQLKTILS